MSYEKKSVNDDIKKMISGIEMAKRVLLENPDDHWVKKGLVTMTQHLSKLINDSKNKSDK